MSERTQREMEVGRLSLSKIRRHEYVADLRQRKLIEINTTFVFTGGCSMHEQIVTVLPDGPEFRDRANEFPSEFLVTQLMLVVG